MAGESTATAAGESGANTAYSERKLTDPHCTAFTSSRGLWLSKGIRNECAHTITRACCQDETQGGKRGAERQSESGGSQRDTKTSPWTAQTRGSDEDGAYSCRRAPCSTRRERYNTFKISKAADR